MSTLSSSNTLPELIDAYVDSASYEEDGDAAKARTFITACRILLVKIPKRSRSGGSDIEIDPAVLRQQLDQASAWLTASGEALGGSAPANPVYASFEDFR